MDDRGRLLSGCTGNSVPRVRIPASRCDRVPGRVRVDLARTGACAKMALSGTACARTSIDRGPVYETVSWAFEPPRRTKGTTTRGAFFFTGGRFLGFRVWFGGRLDEAVAQARDEL